MFDHVAELVKLRALDCPNRKEAILDFWEQLTKIKVEPAAAADIEKAIFDMYAELDFDERQAALQVLLRVSAGNSLRELLIENLGDVWSRFKLLSNQLAGSLAVIEDFDGKYDRAHDRGPYDLDRMFNDAYLILKMEGSRFV